MMLRVEISRVKPNRRFATTAVIFYANKRLSADSNVPFVGWTLFSRHRTGLADVTTVVFLCIENGRMKLNRGLFAAAVIAHMHR